MSTSKKKNQKLQSSHARKRRSALQRKSDLSFQKLEARQLLAAVNVGNTTDLVNADVSSISALIANDGGDGISLREAIRASNNTSGSDTISFDASVFSGGDASVIRLTQGELEITDALSIDAITATDVVLTGDADGDDPLVDGTFITDVEASNFSQRQDNSRVINFRGQFDDDLSLVGLTVTGGRSSFLSPDGLDGGGIRFGFESFEGRGELAIFDSIISGNATSRGSYGFGDFDDSGFYNGGEGGNGGDGGGIFLGYGSLRLVDSVVSGNFAGDGGDGGMGGTYFPPAEGEEYGFPVPGTGGNGGNGGSGGGIFAQSSYGVELLNSSIFNNHAGGGGFGGDSQQYDPGTGGNGGLGGDGGGLQASFAPVTLSNSTINNNSAGNGGTAGIDFAFGNNGDGGDGGDGGGINTVGSTSGFSNFPVTLVNSVVSNNSAGNGGDGFSFGGTLGSAGNGGTGGGISTGSIRGDEPPTLGFNNPITLINSVVDANSAGDFGAGVVDFSSGNYVGGGGIFNRDAAVTLTNSTLSNNSAGSGDGGGILSVSSDSDVTLTNSTLSGNTTDFRGGGISSNSGTITLNNSTVSGNSANDAGGGISSFDTEVKLTNSTLTDNNSSEAGGGIFADDGVLRIANSIVAGNSPEDLVDASDSLTVNNSLIGDNSGTSLAATSISSPDSRGNLIGEFGNPIDPLLGPLANNGGLTLTHALLSGSPAIDAGNNAIAVNTQLETDQRGEARIVDETVDIGAYEFDNSFLLGDTNRDGNVNFLDISPFITLLGGGTFLGEADINRDGNVSFLDISPFITLLANTGSAQSNLAASKSVAPANPGETAVTPKAIAGKSNVSSTALLVAEPQSNGSVTPPVETFLRTETSDAKKVIPQPSPVSRTVTSTKSLPKVPLNLLRLGNSVTVASELPSAYATVAGATNVDTFVGPAATIARTYKFLSTRTSNLNDAVGSGPLISRQFFEENSQRLDLPRESDEHDSPANASTEQPFSTAAELFDAHPESLDAIFDFRLESAFEELI